MITPLLVEGETIYLPALRQQDSGRVDAILSLKFQARSFTGSRRLESPTMTVGRRMFAEKHWTGMGFGHERKIFWKTSCHHDPVGSACDRMVE